jgi:hypothetical protein
MLKKRLQKETTVDNKPIPVEAPKVEMPPSTLETPSQVMPVEPTILETSQLKQEVMKRVQASTLPMQPLPQDALLHLERIVEEAVQGVEERVRNDIRDMHVELIRQFHIQKMEILSLVKSKSF